MGSLKNIVFVLIILCKICDVISLIGYSKVSKDYVRNIKPTDYLVPRLYHPSTGQNINTTSEETLKHIDHLEIILPLQNEELVLDLRLNHGIMSKSFKQVYHKNGKLNVNQPSITELDYCHYTGKIKNKDRSWAVLSTCNGISGIVFDGNKYYFIEKPPRNNSDIHHVYISPSLTHQTYSNYTSRRKRDTFHNVLGGPYNEDANSRYVELALVFDNKVYQKLGGVTEVTSYATQIVNLMNAYYSRVNIFVVLVGVAIWTERDEFVLETGSILNRFTDYANTKLVKEFYFDSAHLISSINVVQDGIGVAGIGTVCDNTCTGVNDFLENILGTAATVAHELGHNLGLLHDSDHCTCPENQCIMIDVRSSNTISYFSSCSIETLQLEYENGKHYCLKNKPEVISSILPSCGNGILEPGEQCDCGLPEYCDNLCCDAWTCTFEKDAECATGSCCDLNSCKLKDASTPCRPASNECDLPEYCTGDSYNCPEDTFKFDTEQCNDGNSYCHQGFCGKDSKCTALKTRLNNKYLECHELDSPFANENNYCKNNIFNNAVFKCNSRTEYFRTCSYPKYETITLDSKAIGIHTSIYGRQGSIMVCTLTVIGDNPAAVQNASLCSTNEDFCLTMTNLRELMSSCPTDCHNNGWCNNKGQCHCMDGYAPPDCYEPGFGGSLLSGPSSNPAGWFFLHENKTPTFEVLMQNIRFVTNLITV